MFFKPWKKVLQLNLHVYVDGNKQIERVKETAFLGDGQCNVVPRASVTFVQRMGQRTLCRNHKIHFTKSWFQFVCACVDENEKMAAAIDHFHCWSMPLKSLYTNFYRARSIIFS